MFFSGLWLDDGKKDEKYVVVRKNEKVVVVSGSWGLQTGGLTARRCDVGPRPDITS